MKKKIITTVAIVLLSFSAYAYDSSEIDELKMEIDRQQADAEINNIINAQQAKRDKEEAEQRHEELMQELHKLNHEDSFGNPLN